MREEYFKASDGQELYLAVWDSVKEPCGVVQILHGMAEHIRRYAPLARYLNDNGFIVVGDDHRAHGYTAIPKDKKDGILGSCEGDIALDTVRDAKEITQHLADTYKLPVVVLGHSYGSFLLQEYLLQGGSDIAGVILSGSAYQGGIMTWFGHLLAKVKCKKNPHKEGQTFVNMTFNAYDKKFKEGEGAWLSRDKVEVQKYLSDDQCGFKCSNWFYKCMLSMAGNLYKKNRLSSLNRDTRLLILSGDRDPVGGFGKLVVRLANFYNKIGMKNVELRLYSGARHEIINEINRVEVYEDILSFAKECIDS